MPQSKGAAATQLQTVVTVWDVDSVLSNLIFFKRHLYCNAVILIIKCQQLIQTFKPRVDQAKSVFGTKGTGGGSRY